MEHQIIKIINRFAPVLVLAFVMQSCYYDNVEELYPNPPACDTTNVSYTDDVWPVINANCTGCHSGGVPAGNVSLENYDDIVVSADNGSLLCTIKHENGCSPMPKGGGKLGDCDITKIEIWVNEGTPDN